MKVFILSANRRCDSNSTDVSVIIKYLKKNNIEIADSIKDADTIIISTCGSITETKKYSEKIVKSIAKKYKDKKIIFFGCLPRIAPHLCDELKQENSNIKIVKELYNLNEFIPSNTNIRIKSNII